MRRFWKPCKRWIPAEPLHEDLPWPGLEDKDEINAAIALGIKKACEARETEEWAKCVISCLLDHVPRQRIIWLVRIEARKRYRWRFSKDQMRMGITT
jgi:hypothetical protein